MPIHAATLADVPSICRLQQEWANEDSVYGLLPISQEQRCAAIGPVLLMPRPATSTPFLQEIAVRMYHLLAVVFAGALLLGVEAASADPGAPGAVLVKDGAPAAVIVLPPEPGSFEKMAAKELADTLEAMSGAKIPTATIDAGEVEAFTAQAKAQGRTPILIGRVALPALEKAIRDKSSLDGTFALQADAGRVLIAGLGEGPYYGVLELLEQQGCRWFMPGDLGTVIPQARTVAVREQTTVQAPSFASRWFQMPHKDWQMRVRCGGKEFGGGHGIPAPKVSANKETGRIEPAEYADFFALVDGKRTVRQHCLSNPRLIAFIVNHIKEDRRKNPGRSPLYGMGPNDGGGFCQCENCRALDAGDYDPFSDEPSTTDRYIWFFNQILKGVNDEFPDTRLAFYIYHTYMRPPLREKPDPRIQGALAPIMLDGIHGFSNPLAPEKSYAKRLYQEWGRLLPDLYDRGYWSNLACPGFTFIIINRLRDEIPVCHDLGVKGWRVETFPNYGPQFPSMYVAAKLMWNHETDVDALLADCYEKFFGPAAKPAGQYITLMDAALRDNQFCTGGAWDMPNFYPPALRAQARALLDEASHLAAGKGVYEERVRMIRQTFDMTDAFCRMMEARVRVDLPAAKAEMDRCDALAAQLMRYKPVPMMVPGSFASYEIPGRFSTYANYMRRYFRNCTNVGAERVTGGNQLVAACQDEWQFQIDPARVGEDIGLWRPEAAGGMWQKIKTSSLSWSDQGLRYYKGLAWYRQIVDVPADAPARRVFLWCGGIDGTAKVWLNGRLLGVHPRFGQKIDYAFSHAAAYQPFEMDASEALRPGPNVVVFCVSSLVPHTLGTGGIVAAVILYAPAAGKDAKLQNIPALEPMLPAPPPVP